MPTEQVREQEQTVWQGSPSWVSQFGTFVVCGLLFWLIIPIGVALWKWLEIRCTQYTLTTQRLSLRTGVFSKKTDEIELYRVKDTQLQEPFFLRMFSCGNIILLTSDHTTPMLVMGAIPDAAEVRERIRALVEMQRTAKRVREVDFE